MNSSLYSISAWADSLISCLNTSTGTGPTGISCMSTTTAVSNCYIPGTTGSVYYNYTPDYECNIRSLVTQSGTPWDSVPNFPPVRVEVNSESKNLRFSWALAGVDKNDVSIEFDEDLLVLSIKKRDKEKKDKSWSILKNGIKSSMHGDYQYEVPSTRYDISKASAKWEDGLLIIEIPLKESAKPVKVKIC